MTSDASTHQKPNGTTSTPSPLQLSIPLPNAPGNRIHMHLTILASSLLLFVSNTGGAEFSSAPPPSLGSFVYAMPDRYNPTQPLSTHLYTLPSSIDFTDRLAKILARRSGKSVHVGSSVTFSSAGNGGTVEEEMEGFRNVVSVVMAEVDAVKTG